MHPKYKKRTLKFIVFFVLMLVFAITEDILAAHISGAPFIIDTLPFIIIIALLFTVITELIEEHFEPGEQPLEHVLHTLEHLERRNIPPTYENIRLHLKKKLAEKNGSV